MVLNRTHPKILLLDDKPIEEQNWIRWCKIIDWSVAIYYCQSINESLSLLENLEPDIYIIDIFLQNELGFEFLEVISERKGLKVVTTNSVNQSDYVRATKYSAFVLNKEYDEKENLETVSLIKNLFEKEKSYALNIARDLLNTEQITRQIEELKQKTKVIQLRVTSIEEDFKIMNIKQKENEEIITAIKGKQENSLIAMVLDEIVKAHQNASNGARILIAIVIIIVSVTVGLYFLSQIIDTE